jgi:hypothetical protein
MEKTASAVKPKKSPRERLEVKKSVMVEEGVPAVIEKVLREVVVL